MSNQPDLFTDIPPMKSPRLLWMEKHGITVERKATSIGPVFIATRGDTERRADNETDALRLVAIAGGIELWNQ